MSAIYAVGISGGENTIIQLVGICFFFFFFHCTILIIFHCCGFHVLMDVHCLGDESKAAASLQH